MKKKYIVFYNGGAFIEDSIDEVSRFIRNLKKIGRYYRNGLIVVDIRGCETQTIVDMSIDYGSWFISVNSLTLVDKMKVLYADYMVDLDELEED